MCIRDSHKTMIRNELFYIFVRKIKVIAYQNAEKDCTLGSRYCTGSCLLYTSNKSIPVRSLEILSRLAIPSIVLRPEFLPLVWKYDVL